MVSAPIDGLSSWAKLSLCGWTSLEVFTFSPSGAYDPAEMFGGQWEGLWAPRSHFNQQFSVICSIYSIKGLYNTYNGKEDFMESCKKRVEAPKEMTPEVPACVWLLSLARGSAAGALQASLDEPTLEHALQASRWKFIHCTSACPAINSPSLGGVSLHLSFSRDSSQILHMADSQGLSLRRKWKSISTVFHISVLPKCCTWRHSPNACLLLSSSCGVQTSPSKSQGNAEAFLFPT